MELDVVPVLRAEGAALRSTLAEQAEGHEQDLHIRDGAIATLTAKVSKAKYQGTGVHTEGQYCWIFTMSKAQAATRKSSRRSSNRTGSLVFEKERGRARGGVE